MSNGSGDHPSRTQIKSIQRRLFPRALAKLIVAVRSNPKRVPHFEKRVEALDRMIDWTNGCSTLIEFREWMLEGDQIGNLLELHWLLQVLIERTGDGFELQNLAANDMVAIRQLLSWWRTEMTAIDRLDVMGSAQEG
jgi:hypothetical protein